MPSDQVENETDQSGIVLYTEDGDPVRVRLYDENMNSFKYTTNPEQGVHGYELGRKRITVVLEKP